MVVDLLAIYDGGDIFANSSRLMLDAVLRGGESHPPNTSARSVTPESIC